MLSRALLAIAAAFAILVAWSLSAPRQPAARRASVAAGPPPAAATALPPRLRSFAVLSRKRAGRQAAPPRRIEIPAIGVDAPVVALGLEPDGTLATPTRWGDTGWYKPGPEPGERGAAVIAGHVDSTSGPAVFFRLRDVRPGDRIAIRRRDGSVVRFRVQRVERWPKSDFPTRRVYGPSRGAALRLVTCAGNFDRSTGHYVDNTIVYASRV